MANDTVAVNEAVDERSLVFCEWSRALASFCKAIPRDGERTANQRQAG